MGDQFTEVTRQSWGSRIGGSIGGIFFGFILVVGAFALLFWNEGRSVKTAKSLAEGAKSVISISADSVDPANEGKLVHLTGAVATDEVLRDPEFGISLGAVKLVRTVEMYQWDETSTSDTDKKIGGGTETTTTYSYDKRWSGHLIDSREFKQPDGHANPASMPVEDREFMAKTVSVGDAFTMSQGLLYQMNNYDRLSVSAAELPESVTAAYKLHDGGLYKGDTPGSPQVGDVRIKFEVIRPGETVSLIARQTGTTFTPYRTKVGRSIEMLSAGHHSADDMFAEAQSQNKVLTWGLRALGYILMMFGLGMLMAPISVLADVVPLFGNIAQVGTGMIAFVFGTFLSLVTIAVAWVTYRPLIGIALIIVSVAPFVLLPRMKKPQSQAAA